jgi:hypothetical protein
MTTAAISRFRFCPKHKKPLPCKHCEMIASAPKPIQAPPVSSTVRKKIEESLAIAVVETSGPPLSIEQQKKQIRAQQARDRRKRNAEQLAAIKEKLKTPIAEIRRAAEEQAKLDRKVRALSSLRRGSFLIDAPTGKGELVTGGYDSEQIELVAGTRERAAILGSPTFDPETGEEYWPENDRGRVVPEGTGHRPGDGEDDEEDDGPDSTDEARDNRTERDKDAPILPGTTFQVKLKDGKEDQKAHDYDLLLGVLVSSYCAETQIFKNEFAYCASCGAKQQRAESVYTCIRCQAKNGGDNGHLHICRLCGSECDGFVEAKQHIHRVHGSESNPEHDDRFGDITRRRKHDVTA